MLGLTALGVVHTVLALVALVTALVALVRDKEIRVDTRLGQSYVWATALTALTGLGIFNHGSFGKPHVLSIVTLAVLALAALARRSTLFGGASANVERVSYSATVLFHLIPGLAESTTRLPPGAPLFASAGAPELAAANGVLFVLFVVGAVLQVRYFRARRAASGARKAFEG